MNRTTRIPIRLQEAGPDTVGSTDTVTLSSPGAALGGPFPAGTSAVGFSGALPVIGAQADAIPLAGTMTATGSGVFSLSGWPGPPRPAHPAPAAVAACTTPVTSPGSPRAGRSR